MKPFRVVCIKEFKGISKASKLPPRAGAPQKGEIYTVTKTEFHDGMYGYSLIELYPLDWWNVKNFRETDSTFGPAVCEQIEQIIELEETIEI